MTQFTCKGVKQINNRISLNMTFTFTIRISRRFSSAREFQMGNFQKYWSQNVGQDLIVLDFFHGRKILKDDGRDPQNREKNDPAGRFTCMIKQKIKKCRILKALSISSVTHTNTHSIIGRNATTKYGEFLWGKAINQSVLMKWKYSGFLNKHVEFHNLHNYFCK